MSWCCILYVSGYTDSVTCKTWHEFMYIHYINSRRNFILLKIPFKHTYAASEHIRRHEYMVNLFLPTKKILAKHQQRRKTEREREFISTWISFSRSYPLFVFIVGAVVVLVRYFSIVKQECSALKYYSTHHLYTHRFVNTDIFFSDKMKLSLYNSVMFYCSFVRSSSNKWE